jgi:hypothetical protein
MSIANKVRLLLGCVGFIGTALSGLAAAQLSLAPAEPTPLDTVRLRWTHVGCTNPDSVRVSMQANQLTVSAERAFVVDCGTIQGYFDEYTLGRLPAGDYEVQLIVNPPPGTLGPSQLIGPIHFVVRALPLAGTPHPVDNYTDAWWDPAESGWALYVLQSGERLVAIWNVYGADGSPVWYTLQPGSWSRDPANNLRYVGTIYRTTGPYWGGPFDSKAVSATAVGTASFIPQATSRARFEYTIGTMSGAKQLMRFVF